MYWKYGKSETARIKLENNDLSMTFQPFTNPLLDVSLRKVLSNDKQNPATKLCEWHILDCGFLVLILTCFILFISCTNSERDWNLLQEADHLSSQYPMEALAKLQQIENSSSMPDSCRALYSFVLNKSLIFSSTPIRSDSSILAAIAYFEQAGDSCKLHESLYLKGMIEYRSMRYKAAIKSFQKSNLIAISLKNQYAVVYNHQLIGYCWNMLGNKTKAVSGLCSAVEVARALNDSSILLSAVVNLANVQTNNLNFKEALSNLNEAVIIARKRKDKEYLYTLYSKQSSLYEQTADFNNALACNDSVRKYRSNREEIPSVNLIRAILYSKQNQTDSAYRYALLAIKGNDNFVADVAYSLLHDLERRQGHLMEALAYSKKFDHLFESFDSNIQSAAMAQKYQKEKLENENNQLKIKKKERDLWLLSIILGIIIITASVYIAFLRYKRNQTYLKQKMQEELLKSKSEQLEQENLLLKQHQEISQLREKEALMRESIFRRINFFHKIPSLTHSVEKGEQLGSKTTRKILLTESDWKELIQNINDAYPNFTDKLSNSYKELDEDDILFCCLLKINVNLQDLSDIYCLSKAAITKKKYRLKKDTFHVTDKNISLDDFLNTF